MRMRPELMGSDSAPIFVPPGQPPPPGAIEHTGGARGSMPGVSLVRSNTQEACATAMLALSGTAPIPPMMPQPPKVHPALAQADASLAADAAARAQRLAKAAAKD